MKTVDLARDKIEFDQLINLARQEPVLILTPDGSQYILSQADDFDQEVEALRKSRSFQRFLDKRSKSRAKIPLSKIEREIEQELSKEKTTA
jgi:hypothetical protein